MTAAQQDAPLELDSAKFTIFHYRDGVEPSNSGAMAVEPGSSENLQAIGECIEAGIMDGAENRLVFRGAGMSLVHAWLKPNYPLPRHSHGSDCLYYVTAGSLRLGARDLTVGDGFFVPANVPYTYAAGPDGVELMEFRSTESFDFRDLTAPAFWARALQLTKDNRAAWQTARRPSGAVLD